MKKFAFGVFSVVAAGLCAASVASAQTVDRAQGVSASATTMMAAAQGGGSASGSTESGVYVRVGAGFQHRQRAEDNPQTYTDWKLGYAFSVAGGYQLGAVGIEGEFSQLNNHDKTTAAPVTGPQPGQGDVTLRIYTANVTYTAKGSGPLALYVAGGLGGYKSYIHDLSNAIAAQYGLFVNSTNDGFPFLYQLKGGVAIDVAPKSAIIIDYRYIHGNDLLFKNTAFGDLQPNGTKNHVFEAALKIGF